MKTEKEVFDKNYEVYRNLHCQPPIPLEARDMIFKSMRDFASQQFYRREELIGFFAWQNTLLIEETEKVVDNYLKSHPVPIEPTLSQPKEITDEMIENYFPTTDCGAFDPRQYARQEGAKAMRDGKIN
jgi:hypothetical protein